MPKLAVLAVNFCSDISLVSGNFTVVQTYCTAHDLFSNRIIIDGEDALQFYILTTYPSVDLQFRAVLLM